MHPAATEPDLALLRRLEPDLELMAAHGVEVIACGPFRALLSRTTDATWANYAVPVDPIGSAGEILEVVAELRHVFVDRRRILRFEFNEALWLTLAAALENAGLRLLAREPLMLCGPSEFRQFINPKVSVRFLNAGDPEPDLEAFQAIFCEGFGLEPPTHESVRRLRAEVARGNNRCAALAMLGGKPVGTGFLASSGGLSELTRIATTPAARRRGVAATMTSWLVRDGFDRGNTLAWLTAADAVAQALYQKLGFRLVGDRLSYEADAR